MNQKQKEPLQIDVNEKVAVKDYLETYKQWIGRLKHFYTVKILPPLQK